MCNDFSVHHVSQKKLKVKDKSEVGGNYECEIELQKLNVSNVQLFPRC